MDRAGQRPGIQAEHTTAYDIELQESNRSTPTSMTPTAYDANGLPIPRPTWERPDYSDLIVCEAAPQAYDDGMMAVNVDGDGDEKVLARGGSGMPLSPSSVDPVPAYSPAHRTSTLPLHAKGEYAEWDARSAPPPKEQRRILGVAMSKKKASFMAIGALAFILILLATVLGITLTMNISSNKGKAGDGGSDGDDDADAASSDGGASGANLLNTASGLAALNWTDPLNLDRSAVFWQDSSDAIMVSLRDKLSNEWTSSNVTAALMNSTGSSKLDVLHGTPLAVVTNRYQVSLYYLNSERSVSEIYSPDIMGDVWYSGSLANSLDPLTTIEGTHLTAFWQLCDNCTNSLFVMFQDDTGAVKMANLTNDVWEFGTVPDALAPLSATGLALRPYTDNGGAGEYGTAPVDLRMYSFDTSGLVEAKYGPITNSTWEVETASTTLASTIAADASPELAAITYGSTGITKSIVSYLTPQGGFMEYIYDGATWTSGEPEITDGLSNYTAIAAAQNMMVYACYNGSIYEYQVDSADPLSWKQFSVVLNSS